MFHSAALKLTLWYLAIIMAISLIFSVSIYHVSGADLDRNLNRQVGYFSGFLGPNQALGYQSLRDRQLSDDLGHLRTNLFLFNLLVLVGGGAASYWLARRTLQPIEDALDSQSRFASDASHELRTPLAAIQTENEVALRDKNLTKSQAVGLLKSNLEEVAKLKALAEGLLRLTNGNGAIADPEPIALKDVVSAAADRYAKTARAKKIRLDSQIGDQTAVGDRDSLVELVSILLDNAIKYSPPGSQVDISSQRHGKSVLLKISDQGAGIKASDLPHIFERFYRTDNSRAKDSPGGYGLGLALAKGITDAHGGHIEVASTVGQGTQFSVFLPAA